MTNLPAKVGASRIPPFCLGITICDAVWMDPATGKYTILGVFSAAHSPVFPSLFPGFVGFVTLTNGHGTTPISMRLVRLDEENTEAARTNESQITWQDPNQVIDCIVQMPPFRLEEPGVYLLIVCCGDEQLMERRFVVAGPQL